MLIAFPRVAAAQTVTFYGSDAATPSFSVFDSLEITAQGDYIMSGGTFTTNALNVIDISSFVPGTKTDIFQVVTTEVHGMQHTHICFPKGQFTGNFGMSRFPSKYMSEIVIEAPPDDWLIINAGGIAGFLRTGPGSISSESVEFSASYDAWVFGERIGELATTAVSVQGIGATSYAYSFVPSAPYVSGNWTAAETGMPDGAGATAVFPASAAGSMSVSGARTVGNWLVEGSSPYTFNGSGSITLSQTGHAQVSVSGGATHVVNAQLTLASDTSFYVNSSTQLNVAGTLSVGSTTLAISKLGSGTLSIPAVSVNTIRAVEGRLKINSSGTVSRTATVAISGAAKNSSGTTIFSGGALDLASSGSGLIVDYDASATISPMGNYDIPGTIAFYLKNGHNGGSWTGAPTDGSGNKLPVMNSSFAAANSAFGVGFGEASEILGSSGGTFLGQPVDGSTVLIRVVRDGDANLDGSVNSTDYGILAIHYGQSGKMWYEADFNYDGYVNSDDYNLLAGNFGLSVGPEGPSATDWGALASAVPEPGGGVLLLLVTAACRCRSRRRAKW